VNTVHFHSDNPNDVAVAHLKPMTH